jgi:hypothetical protein
MRSARLVAALLCTYASFLSPPDSRGHVLETGRLNLRELTEVDAEFILAQLTIPHSSTTSPIAARHGIAVRISAEPNGVSVQWQHAGARTLLPGAFARRRG